jgi:hypothetical protein
LRLSRLYSELEASLGYIGRPCEKKGTEEGGREGEREEEEEKLNCR